MIYRIITRWGEDRTALSEHQAICSTDLVSQKDTLIAGRWEFCDLTKQPVDPSFEKDAQPKEQRTLTRGAYEMRVFSNGHGTLAVIYRAIKGHILDAIPHPFEEKKTKRTSNHVEPTVPTTATTEGGKRERGKQKRKPKPSHPVGKSRSRKPKPARRVSRLRKVGKNKRGH